MGSPRPPSSTPPARDAPPPKGRVVVTGIGPVCAAGVGRRGVSQALSHPWEERPAPLHDPRAEGIPVDPAPLFRPDWSAVEAVLSARHILGLPPDPELRLAAAAAVLALEDARLGEDLATAALVATWEAPGMDRLLRGLFEDFRRAAGNGPREPEAVFQRFYAAHKEAAYSTQSFLVLHVLAKSLGVHGHTLFVNNACASGLYALDAAASLVANGKADAAVVVAAESPCFPTKRLWFAEGGLHSSDGFLRPFDAGRTGLILGEGAAGMVLEARDGALARGARIRAEYLGGHFNQEGWKVAIPNFAEAYHEEAVRGACAAAGLAPESIDVVVAHGAGTALSDAYESRGLTSVFGKRPERPLLTALKGWFGHTLGASALLELCVVLGCLEEGFLPATAGFRTPDPRLGIQASRAAAPLKTGKILKVSNGFAGFNAAVVLDGGVS